MNPTHRTSQFVDQQQYYNGWWRGIDGWSFVRWVPEEREILMRRFIGSGQKVLDVGCGDGSAYAQNLTELGVEVHGVDISDVAVAEAFSRGLQAVRANLDEPLPFSDNQFDAVLCIDIIIYLADPEFAVQEMLRVLKPYGKLIICVNNVGHWRNRFDHLFLGHVAPMGSPITSRRYPWRDPALRLFNPESLSNLLTDVGFEIEELAGWETSFWNRMPVLRDVFELPLMRPFHAPLQKVGRRYYRILAGTCVAVGRKPGSPVDDTRPSTHQSGKSLTSERKKGFYAAFAMLATTIYLAKRRAHKRTRSNG